ncbi:low affinity iron permease family protein [Kitasatospora sp. NPDC054939]
MRIEHPAVRAGHDRTWFERLAETASNLTASRLFYVCCVLLVLANVVVHLLGAPLSWQLAAGDAMTAVTLLLLALLKNAERRAEHAVQRKLDAIATALLEQRDGADRDTRRTLDEAIGMDEEV